MVSNIHILSAYKVMSFEMDVVAAKAKAEAAQNAVYEAERRYLNAIESVFGNVPGVTYFFSTEKCENLLLQHHVYVQNKCVFCGFNKYPHDDDYGDITGNDGLDPVGG